MRLTSLCLLLLLTSTAYSKENKHHKIKKYISITEQEYKLPKKLLTALIEQESNYKIQAVNNSTRPASFGLGQITLPAAKDYCKIRTKKELFQHDKNIKCAAKILKRHIKKYGKIHYALAAYRGGTPCKKDSEIFRPCTKLDNHYITSILRKQNT